MKLQDSTAMRGGIFLLGIMLIAFGVALTAKASLGNSPISAIPYSLSLILPVLTFGGWVILFNLLMVAVEYVLLFGKISMVNIAIQVALTFTFGGVVDASMFVLQIFEPDTYVLKLLAVVAGCVIISAGRYVSCTQTFPYCRATGLSWLFPLSQGVISDECAFFPILPCLSLLWLSA